MGDMITIWRFDNSGEAAACEGALRELGFDAFLLDLMSHTYSWGPCLIRLQVPEEQAKDAVAALTDIYPKMRRQL
jgi:hypothetical protein